MNVDTIKQLVRIIGYAAGSYFFSAGVADGELFQQALGGGVAVVAFIWWVITERNKPAV